MTQILAIVWSALQFRAVGVSISALVIAGCTVAMEGNNTADEVLSIASPRSYYQDGADTPHCIQRWQKSVSVAIVGDYHPQQGEIVDKAIDDFSLASGLSIARNDALADRAQLQIELFTLSGPLPRKYRHLCMASLKEDVLCQPKSALVRLPANLDPDQFSYCVYHELMHALGFRGHAWGKDSILNPKSTRTSLTSWDVTAFEILYKSKDNGL